MNEPNHSADAVWQKLAAAARNVVAASPPDENAAAAANDLSARVVAARRVAVRRTDASRDERWVLGAAAAVLAASLVFAMVAWRDVASVAARRPALLEAYLVVEPLP